ncbi:uncharacterized protein L3040_006165 [Drepanopeziza brunnea f. sp. 'multigermtubi']|uniref:uncharacterized protein n=1 Tax=Drepanopeziza brunnea f. sp. 'multigermtubi' TaxID=698441 RepID=UPI0023924F42|nr:hypothetical protein L3040_006165 [Drepanopeziza brunnea f. sp. 'multigermtubi']
MSASPSGQSNGPTPKGDAPLYVRRSKAADPLRPRKKPVRRTGAAPHASTYKPNGLPVAGRPTPQYPVNGKLPPRGAGPGPNQSSNVPGAGNSSAKGGWTTSPEGQFMDYPLFTTKRAMREGLRYHIARFASKKPVDPSDQNEFTRPVLLHRRDPRQPPPGKGVKDEDQTTMEAPMDSKEREKQEIAKAEKEKQRALDLAQIAPTGNNAAALAAKKTQAFRHEKTTQVYRLDKTEEQKKLSDLKYEEALAWHLEDADNKNTWVGNYEAALSDTNVIFVIEGASFKMIPIEKWYRFTPKGQFKTYTIEEAETQMAKKHKESRWVMKTNEQNESQRAVQESRKAMGSLFTVKAESNTFKSVGKREVQEMDDMDFEEGDLFQDDDEQVTFDPENDEDAKDAQERVKRDRQGANVFDQTNEADVDEEEAEDKKAKEARKKLGKDVTKALRKRERNFVYNSDSDHPYSDSSEDDTSDEEKQKEIDKKKDEEAKNKEKAEEAKNKEKAKLDSTSKPPSGASTKGANTPSGRPKHTDPLEKVKNLKRAGSPNLSESSGNESTRKKLKKKHQTSASGSSTPVPGSRPMSPAPQQAGPGQISRKGSLVNIKVNQGKLSDIVSAPPNPSPVRGSAAGDGEATGGEGSDGGKAPQKIKIHIASRAGSRAGSPAAASGESPSSRAQSPSARAQSPSARAQSPGAGPVGPVQAHEIRKALPARGIPMKDLLKVFVGRVTADNRADFIRLVKSNSAYGQDKLLRPKTK